MIDEKVMKELLQDIVVDEKQGYAFYFEKDDDIYEEYHGFREPEKLNRIDKDTNFRMASITKQFVAYGILLLIRNEILTDKEYAGEILTDENPAFGIQVDRKLDFETKLSDLYDDLPDCMKPMTIRQLLTHTSGLYDYEDKEHDDDIQIRDPEVFEYLKTIDKTYFEPGTKYEYSNTGFIILGQIIEKISGVSLSSFIREKMFVPAGMDNSSVNMEGMDRIKNRAYGTSIVGGDLVLKDQSWMSGTCADGGIYSSVTDLRKWIDFISGQEWLYDSMFKQNFVEGYSNQFAKEGSAGYGFTEKSSTDYGYGMKVIKYDGCDIIYHWGDTIGTNSIIGFIPKKKTRFIFMTNLDLINTGFFMRNLIGHFDKF